MSNPYTIPTPRRVLTKIPTPGTHILINRVEGSAKYYITHRTANFPAPDLPDDLDEPKGEWVLVPSPAHEFKADDISDVYIYCVGGAEATTPELKITVINANGVTSVTTAASDAPAIEHFLFEELNDVVILGAPARNTDVLNLAPGHGFLNPVVPNADYLNIHYVDPEIPGFVGNRFSQHVVTNVTGDTITITPPIAYDLDPAKVEFSKRVNVNMAVNGTRLNKLEFKTYPPNGSKWEIRRFMPSMILTTSGDDGKFGNLNPLVEGLYFGFENPFFAEYNVFIFDNGDFASSAYDVKYPIRSGGGGSFGMNVRKSIAGEDKSGVVITLNGVTSDEFKAYIQDPLGAIPRFRIKITGDIKP
jgi:hypothetical protein